MCVSMYPGKMNLPTQSMVRPPNFITMLVVMFVMRPSWMNTVALRVIFPSAGFIIVPPTSAMCSPCADSDRTERVIAARNFILLLTSMETDLSLWRLRRSHELANGIEYHLELCVVFLLQIAQFASEIGVGKEHLAQAHECAHDGDVNLHRASAAQHAGQHCDALLGKRIRQISPATTPAL